MAPPSLPEPPPDPDAPASVAALRLVGECALFGGLPDAARLEIAGQGRARPAAKGEVLFRESEPATELAVVARGRVKLSRRVGGSTILIQLIGPADVCDWPGVLTDELRSCDAVAAESGSLLVFDRQRLGEIGDRHPALYRDALRILSRRQRDLAERYREFGTLRVPQRLARAVLRLASPTGRWLEEGGLTEIPLTRRELAQIAGTTLFTVSRLLRDWAVDGVVKTRRELVRVERPEALAAIGRYPGP